MPDFAENWSNDAEGERVNGVDSTADCQKLCKDNENCFQTLYDGKVCILGTDFFKLGYLRNATETQRWQSSWNRSRIAAWVSSHPCDAVKFTFENVSNGLLGYYSA
jgi:hypothetical protein